MTYFGNCMTKYVAHRIVFAHPNYLLNKINKLYDDVKV